MDLIQQALDGDCLAISRLLSEVEDETPYGQQALDELYARGGQAAVIGITGPSGSGKSTLVNQLALAFSRAESGTPRKVGIIAVDPSSPFSGGALLGDRVRMRDLGTLPNVFIRSMATRGALGGLARAAEGAVQVLDAAGFDLILVETVGAGQSEVEIVRLAHTTVVVEAPGLGDDVQAAKAGILEIADVLVLNKKDKSGAQAAAHALQTMLEMGAAMADEMESATSKKWKVPLVMTCALDGTGVEDMADTIQSHQVWLRTHGGWKDKEKQRVIHAIESVARERLFQDWREHIPSTQYDQMLTDVLTRRLSPRQAINNLLED